MQVTTEQFDAVICATGNYHEPNLPDLPGLETYPGDQLHCHNFRNNASYKGKTVLIVGAAFSGMIACTVDTLLHSSQLEIPADKQVKILPFSI